jgi:hypothetical protein
MLKAYPEHDFSIPDFVTGDECMVWVFEEAAFRGIQSSPSWNRSKTDLSQRPAAFRRTGNPRYLRTLQIIDSPLADLARLAWKTSLKAGHFKLPIKASRHLAHTEVCNPTLIAGPSPPSGKWARQAKGAANRSGNPLWIADIGKPENNLA